MTTVMRVAAQLRSEFRLLARPLTLGLMAAFVLVCLATAALGQEYVSTQVDIAMSGSVSSCEELKEVGFTEDCEIGQAGQRESIAALMELAAEIGPPGRSSQTAVGALSFALGHIICGVGGVLVGGLATLTVASERESGLLEQRSLAFGSSARALATRVTALVAVGLAAAAVAWAAVVIFNSWSRGAWPIPFSPDRRGGWSFVLRRLVLAVLALAAWATVAIGLSARARSRLSALGLMAIVVALNSLLAATWLGVVLPGVAAQQGAELGSDPSYIDHLPFVRVADVPLFVSILFALASTGAAAKFVASDRPRW